MFNVISYIEATIYLSLFIDLVNISIKFHYPKNVLESQSDYLTDFLFSLVQTYILKTNVVQSVSIKILKI